jgi:3-isopropylmalate dehydrogenase
MRLVVISGDGIGPEITNATIAVVRAAEGRFGLELDLVEDIVGHASLQRYGTTVRPQLLDIVRSSDGLVLGPTATFDFKDEAQGEINPSMYFRKNLDLYANIRPCRTYAGAPGKLGEFDMVIVRENTEGFYADRNMARGNGEILITPDVSIAIRRITRQCCERIAHQAFKLALERRRHVTFVHKANVLKTTDGMFVDICRSVAASYPSVTHDEFIVDAMMAHVVRKPSRFDVIVTTNMYGDILSDLVAELSGSLGLGGSVNVGVEHGMAQAVHGSAPDIAGRDIANPFSLVLSVAQLFAWYGKRTAKPEYVEAASGIEAAVAEAISFGDVTHDMGGALGTSATGARLARRLLDAAGSSASSNLLPA